MCAACFDAQAIFCRRRHQPRRPPLAKIRPGRPAPAMGPGTAFIAPNSPCVSPLIPSVKKRVLGLPLLPPVPKPRDQRPPGVLPTPTSIGIVPRNMPVSGSKALISLATKLKLPTSRSPPNGPKLAGARVMPHGAARGVSRQGSFAPMSRSHRKSPPLPPVPRRIGRYLGWTSGRRIGHSQIPVAEGLHVERDEVECADRGGGRNCAVSPAEGAVEDVECRRPAELAAYNWV